MNIVRIPPGVSFQESVDWSQRPKNWAKMSDARRAAYIREKLARNELRDLCAKRANEDERSS